MRTRRPWGAVRGSDDGTVLGHGTRAFWIFSYFPVAYGSKVAKLVVEIDGVGSLSLDLFRPADRDDFIAPRSIRSKYSGLHERTVKLEFALGDEILRAIEAREKAGSVAP